MRIVFGSHTSIGGTFVIGSHHLAREMRHLGHEVVHVSTPVTPAHVVRLHDPEVRRRFALALRPTRPGGVANLVPMAALPWSLKRGLPGLWGRDLLVPPRGLRRSVHSHLGGPPDILIVDQPKLVGLADVLSPTHTVYRATDVYQTMSGNAGTLRAELSAVRRADLLVATSQPVAEHLVGLGARRSPMVIPNGVDHEMFVRPAPRPPEYDADVSRRRAVYVGALDYRFDFRTVDLLAPRFPEVEFVLIGPSTALSREWQPPPNVTLLGSRPYDQVPAYLQHAQVGLLLMNEHVANAGRSPMKLYEYGAAGLRVLARRTPELVRRDEPFVATYADAESAVAGMRAALASDADQGHGALRAPSPERIARVSWSGLAQRLLTAAVEQPSGRGI